MNYLKVIQNRGKGILLVLIFFLENGDCCLLYTSPSPRDGLLSIRRQRQDVYKRQPLSVMVVGYELSEGHSEPRERDPIGSNFFLGEWGLLSLIHISEPTRRTPLYSSAASRCV